jgi:hypothetical protein
LCCGAPCFCRSLLELFSREIDHTLSHHDKVRNRGLLPQG